MKLYLDSSILVKLYFPEPESRKLAEWIKKSGKPILFTQFHELEITNALALKVFRDEIFKESFNACLKIIGEDKRNNILETIAPN